MAMLMFTTRNRTVSNPSHYIFSDERDWWIFGPVLTFRPRVHFCKCRNWRQSLRRFLNWVCIGVTHHCTWKLLYFGLRCHYSPPLRLGIPLGLHCLQSWGSLIRLLTEKNFFALYQISNVIKMLLWATGSHCHGDIYILLHSHIPISWPHVWPAKHDCNVTITTFS